MMMKKQEEDGHLLVPKRKRNYYQFIYFDCHLSESLPFRHNRFRLLLSLYLVLSHESDFLCTSINRSPRKIR